VYSPLHGRGSERDSIVSWIVHEIVAAGGARELSELLHESARALVLSHPEARTHEDIVTVVSEPGAHSSLTLDDAALAAHSALLDAAEYCEGCDTEINAVSASSDSAELAAEHDRLRGGFTRWLRLGCPFIDESLFVAWLQNMGFQLRRRSG
jgi:hypothetical protein